VIPEAPEFTPSATARAKAVALLGRALPLADDVSSHLTEHVRFVDCGANFETVHCPGCGTDMGEWWTLAIEAGHELQFRDLRVTVPCCGLHTSLNDLRYAPPMGFARFSLEVLNPGVETLPERIRLRLERELASRVRVIWAEY
jgi:hypothetical protein